jgi:hypothetical protein
MTTYPAALYLAVLDMFFSDLQSAKLAGSVMMKRPSRRIVLQRVPYKTSHIVTIAQDLSPRELLPIP